MMVDTRQLAGVACTATGTVLASMSMSEILYIVSLILTILGTIWSLIVWPLIQWYRKSKADGKITKEEIDEGIDTLNKGIEDSTKIINESVDETKSKIDSNSK